VGEDVLAVVGGGEGAGPAVEHLEGVDAGEDLAAEVLAQEGGHRLHQAAEQGGAENIMP
jgi:hypothetical protein